MPNLVPEAPVRSVETGRVRFFDYLGLERETNDPLLIVETKRPSALLPRLTKGESSWLPDVVARGLAGEPLTGEWSEWLRSLKDYVRSAKERSGVTPKRVVLTNGDWLILFLDPEDAFLKEDTAPDPSKILIFQKRDEIEQRFREIFNHLEHSKVLGEIPPLTPAELPFHLRGEDVDRVMHGLRLRYIEQKGIYGFSPVIKVAPVILLRSRYGAWFRVEMPPKEYELPQDEDRLFKHLDEVRATAEGLLEEVNDALGTSFRPVPLRDHYDTEETFEPIKGVCELSEDDFLIVTGDKTHYILPSSSVPNCPFHDWRKALSMGVASNSGPIMTPSVDPRSYFVSGKVYHCAHRDVDSAKATQITAQNRPQCGLRSGNEGEAFCEIWRFERFLCCRTCVFEEVCSQAPAFHLPCEKGG